MINARSLFTLRSRSTRLESLIKEIRPKKLTGLLKVTFDACDGIIVLDEGSVIDGYEIFNNELLVKDQDGYHIKERYKFEPVNIDVCEVKRETLQTFIKTLQESPQRFKTLFSSVCINKWQPNGVAENS
ncbi:MAG: hypothetical protein HXS44_11290 [Theionarchaea archaeon]|nr:hypothetical protein [Theionarchaea archaeon]